MEKFIVIVLFFVVLISFTNYAYGINVGILPFDVAINPITNKTYVAHGDGTVSVIDANPLNTGTYNTVIGSPIVINFGKALTGIVVDTDTNKVYVANSGDSNVAVIDGTSDTLLTTIQLVSPIDDAPVGVFTLDVEINTNLNTLYVSNVLSGTVVVIDLNVGSPTENKVIDVLSGFDSPSRFTFDPNTNLMYMTNFLSNTVSVFDGLQNSFADGTPLVDTITIGNSADGIKFNPANQKIYTANSADDTVSVIDANPQNFTGTYRKLIDTIPVGVNPASVTVDSANNRIYVTNRDDGTLSVIDGTTDTVTKTIPTDITTATPRPRGLDVHNVTSDVYVTNGGFGIATGSVTVIDFTTNNPPVASAGLDQAVNEGVLVTLNGTGSSDPDGDTFGFVWTEVTATGVTLSDPTTALPTFTSQQVDADTLITFALVVADLTPSASIADIVNVVVKDITSFTVLPTLTDGVVSGNHLVGKVFDGSTYSLKIDNPPGALPNAELQQLVLPVGVDGNAVNFTFTESPIVTGGITEPDINTSLFFDLNFSGVDFSQAINFDAGKLPKIQFLIDKNFEPSPSGFQPAPRFADGCLDVQLQLFDEGTGQWGQVGSSLVANSNRIYVSNAGLGTTSGTLSVIDGSTNNVIDTITVGFAPKLVAFDQTTNRIYVVNQGSNTVSVIDGSTNSVISTITVGLAPAEPVVNPNTNLIYVTNQGDGTVSVIDGVSGSPTENTVIATIATGITPGGIDVDTTLKRVYVANTFGSTVSVIDANPLNTGTYNTVITPDILVPQPSGLVIDSSNNLAYVTNFDSRSVSVINTAINTIIAVIGVGPGPTDLSFNPTTDRLYVTNQLGAGTVSIIDTTINAEIDTVPTGNAPFQVEVNPNTNRVYVSDRGSGTVSVIDGMPGSLTENQVIDTITGFSNNFGIALNSVVPNPVRDPSKDDGGQCAYIAKPPHFSKFAIGGVKALAIAGLVGGGGGTDGSPPMTSLTNLITNKNFDVPDEIVKIVENYDPTMILEPISTTKFADFDLPLTINENGYPLSGYSNTIQTFLASTGEPMTITSLFYEQTVIQHVSMYMNLRGIITGDLGKSDTQILYNKDKPLQVIDPNGFFEKVSVNIIEDDDTIKKFVEFEIIFAKPMDTSDIVLRSWDDKLRSMDTIIYDAIGIIDPASIVETVDPEPVEDVIEDVAEIQKVPEGIKNISEWWSQGEVDDTKFKEVIQFLIQEEIIDVLTGPNVSVSKDDELAQEELQLDPEPLPIPNWIKNNAEWWSQGVITEDDFLKSIKYLVEYGIIQI